MLKSLEIRITSKCNSRCLICHVWKTSPEKKDTGLTSYKKLFSHPEFRNIEEIFISGGEPFCRQDLEKTILGILKFLPNVSRFFLTTNGTFPEKTLKLYKELNKIKKITALRLGVSLEGDRKMTKKIRGIDSYESALKTLRLCQKNIPRLKTRILMTLTRYNCNKKSLDYLLTLARQADTTFSFRPFYNCDSCHYNYDLNLSPTKRQRLLTAEFIKKNLAFDRFLSAQADYLITGQMPLMEHCSAGVSFADIRQDGSVYPCINSARQIGDPNRGIFLKRISDLGEKEPCPCCDEGCFYSTTNNH